MSTRRRILLNKKLDNLQPEETFKPVNGNVADIVYYDYVNAQYVAYPIYTQVDNAIPIGVVAVPADHNVYGDYSCGIVSMVDMTISNPNEGGSPVVIYYGGYGVDTPLQNYDCVNLVSGGVSTYGFLPSDRFNGYNTPSVNIPNAYKQYSTERNPEYYETRSGYNALSDFDGRGNTNILIDMATGQADWRTSNTITNYPGAGYHAAACCCWRYCPEGTTQGQWYLPAIGELGYMLIDANAIYNSISWAGSTYGVSYTSFSTSYEYVSSTEQSSTNVYGLYINSGYTGPDCGKNNGWACVRAFTRL